MKVATWNVNSIRIRRERLLAWITSAQPDVLCLQELKCVDEHFPADELRTAGFHCASYGQKTYNGVAIVSKFELTDVLRGLGDGEEDPHARVLAATARGLRVVSVYAPNGQSPDSPAYQYKLRWYDRLRAYLERRHRPSDALIVAGDFNVAPEPIDVHDPVLWEGQVLFSPPERQALKAVVQFGLVDLFRLHHSEGNRYSWWDYRMLGFPKNRGLRIDHIFGTEPVAAKCGASEIDREARKGTQPSDHAPVWAELDFP